MNNSYEITHIDYIKNGFRLDTTHIVYEEDHILPSKITESLIPNFIHQSELMTNPSFVATQTPKGDI